MNQIKFNNKKNKIQESKARLISKVFILPIFLLIILLSISYISAYQRLCLGYGQSIPNDQNPRYTCHHDVCQICVTDNLYPTHPNRCNDIKGCEILGNNSSIDQDPPELVINSPVQGEVYNSRKVLFDLSSNEPASFYYIDNINGRGRWKRLASNVYNYFRGLSLKDGLNNLTFKAVDRKGNFAEIIKSFYVDSKKPKIRRTYPKKGFANSEFSVEFKEENPDELILYYGNNAVGFKENEVNIKNDCYLNKNKYYCDTNVDLSSYNSQEIEYWFELEDIAGSVGVSKHVLLEVDMTAPIILNPDFFWTQGKGKKNKYIYFDIKINEKNFDEVSYIDWEARKPRWKKLCSRLKDKKCIKKKSFRKGHHILDIQVSDEAGNAISERVEFWIV